MPRNNPKVAKRLTPDALRRAALEEARMLLIEQGPQAITLKAVAQRINRTHANLLHHFGSAAGLQGALAAYLAENVREKIHAAVIAARSGEATPRAVVDLAFDAFDSQGAGMLTSWMKLSGNEDALDPILQAIHALVDEIAAQGESAHNRVIHDDTLLLVLVALGQALMGARMAGALGRSPDRARELMAAYMEAQMAKAEQGALDGA